MSNIFGGSQSKSTQQSSNLAFPGLSGSLSGTVGQGAGAGNQLANLLGLNGSQGQNSAFDAWRGGTGYNFGLNQGTQAITGGAATKGLLNSGSTAKALQTYGQGYADQQFGNYANQLQGLLGSGLQASNVISGAGQVSSGQSTANQNGSGVGGAIGALLSK